MNRTDPLPITPGTRVYVRPLDENGEPLDPARDDGFRNVGILLAPHLPGICSYVRNEEDGVVYDTRDACLTPVFPAESSKNRLDDEVALDAIAALLDGVEWQADDIEAVASIVRAAGRTVREPIEEEVVETTES